MSGDCGHGWGYHNDGPSGPCYKCLEQEQANDMNKLWKLFVEEVRADIGIKEVENFLGSVKRHKACFNKAVAKLNK